MDSNPGLTPTEELKSYFAKFSVIRLGIMVFLLVLVMSEVTGLSERGMRLEIQREAQYILYFIAGFGLSIVYLLAARRFIGSMLLFRFQLLADLFLTTWWVVLTGGTFSGFVVLYILCLFFYGRIVGFKSIVLSSLVVWVLLFLISCVQFYFPEYWDQAHIRGSDLAYNYSLLTLALILVSALVRLSSMAENRLLLRLMEQEGILRRSEELKYRVFDWIDAGLLVVDHRGRITTINRHALGVLSGVGRQRVIDSRLEEFFPEFSTFWEERSASTPRRNMVESTARGRIFGFKMTELPDNQGWMILFSDITEVQRLERQLKEMEKLASVGELAAGLAHEMRNPLAGIKASLQLLVTEDLERDFAIRLSAVILRDIDRLDILLKDFLVFARPKAPEPEPLNLGEVIEEALIPLRLQHPRVKVTVQVGDEPYSFDRNQLHQILINLLVNAMQALEGTEEPRVTLSETREQGRRILTIADNGPGLADGMIGRCFDPFVTTKPVGSGLGLAIARRLAIQNSAFIDLHNAPQGGAMAILIQDTTRIPSPPQAQDVP